MPAKPPSRLVETQTWLRAVITDPRGVSAALSSPLPPQEAASVSMVVADGKLSPERRLGVYSNAYFVRLLEVLGACFRASRRVLGEENFRRLAADYLQRHPSHSPLAEDLGKKYPIFFSGHPLARSFPHVSDLARLEWAFLKSLMTNRRPPLPPAELKAAAEKDLSSARFEFDPTVQLLEMDFDVSALFENRFNKKAEKPGAKSPRRKKSALLFRNDDWVQVEWLEEEVAMILKHMLAKRTLAAACRKAERKYNAKNTTEVIQKRFGEWIREGVIKGVRFIRV